MGAAVSETIRAAGTGQVPPAAELLSVALEVAAEAARRIAETPPASVRTKAHLADLVTDLDRAIEADVRDAVLALYPESGWQGEEFGASGPADASLVWFCDPVDGTTNYANQIGWCSFSLAAFDADGPLVGVVADPFRREIFAAARGEGATLWRTNDEFDLASAKKSELHAYDGDTLAGTVVTTEWLAHLPWPGMTETMAALAEAGATVRIMGSSALSLAQVAAGRAAACVIGVFSPIDGAAAALIAAEAGATVTDDAGLVCLAPATGAIVAAGAGVSAAVRAARVRP